MKTLREPIFQASIFALATVAAITIVGAALLDVPATAKTAPARPASPSVAALQATEHAGETDAGPSRATMSSTGDALSAPRSGALVAAAASSPDGDQQRAKEQAAHRVEMLAAQMANEPIDREWADAAESGIVATIEQSALAGVTVNAVECRSSLCRLTVKLDDTGAMSEAVQSLALAIPWNGQRYGYAPASEPGALIVFAAREGKRLRLQ